MSSSARLAEYFIEEKKPATPIEEEPAAVTAPAEHAPAETTFKNALSLNEETKEGSSSAPNEATSTDENQAIEDALKKSSFEGKKETLVDDLNAEIDGGEEDEDTQFEHLEKTGNAPPRSRNAGVSAEKKGSQEEAKSSLTLDKEGSDDEVRTIDLEAKTTESQPAQYDYSVMDELLEFFDQETLEPILCGYFNKILQALVTKSKPKVLQYLLLQRKGDIFDMLLKHLQHHSLAQLMVELMQTKITPQAASTSAFGSSGRARVSSDYDNKTDEDEDENKSKNEQDKEQLSPAEQAMSDTLNQKRQQVITALIENISSKNRDDFEAALNAHTILTELCENEITFSKLIQKENVLKLTEAACDLHNTLCQAYALSVLSNIIKEYPDFERSINHNQAVEF